MKILAIGGGGAGGWGAGGGSGYISYTTRTISTEEIRIYVGDEGQHSVVTLNDNEVRAEPGEDGAEYRGGRGTGEDVTQYKFDHYKLSPGDAGERYESSYGYYYGGGGGGVLINGVGPDRD